MYAIRSFTIVATFAAVVVGAAPASADSIMSGHYTETVTNPETGKSVTNDWYFTSCGDGCTDLSVPATGGSFRVLLVNGQWTFDSSSNSHCPDGTIVPSALSTHTTWDPNSLAGTAKNTQTKPACGMQPGDTFTNNVQLAQVP